MKKDFAGFIEYQGKKKIKDYSNVTSGKDSIVFNSLFLGIVVLVFALCLITS